MAAGSAVRALALEYKSLQDEPVEGFRVNLVSEDDMFVWEVALFGPPDTLYQGGYFKVGACSSAISWCTVRFKQSLVFNSNNGDRPMKNRGMALGIVIFIFHA